MNNENGNVRFGRNDAARIDALADEFERALKAGQSPKIEEFLDRVGEGGRPAALRELLKVEIELRRGRRESVNADDYLGRFSNFEQVVLDACRQSDVALATAASERASQMSGFDTATFAQDDSVAVRARLQVRCPSCHAPVHLDVDTALTDVTCTACGSQFSLINENDVSQLAPSLATMGRFELVSRLGMGAFGAVWKARDKELDRLVAIKIPRAGGMTAEEQEKFFREARAAAQLRHPNIVSVHEVGRDGDSVYIVSDFVRGATLGDWLTGQKITGREAAELCAKIADALHHAHEHGVIHRDLKPANIMIDGDGQPHIMDFGLARREVGEISVTLDGHILGTPAYMSPEQAEGRSHAADRRSDIYSLGVVLFQLLTGELPFRGNVRMIMHQVIHDEPPSPRKLNANISKDLETITLKCLDKSPDCRYQSARELAQECRRFLAGEPIQARPIGRTARAWRWAKRRPTAAALLALLIFAAAGFALAFVRERDLRFEVSAQKAEADRQRTEANRQRKDADEQRAVAESRKSEVEAERDNANAVASFLTDDVLGKASPEQMHDKAARDMIVKSLIEPAAATVGDRFKDKPRIEAEVRGMLASTLRALGRSDLALPHAERALERSRYVHGEDHPDTAICLNNYGGVLKSLGRLQEVEPLYKQSLEQHRKIFGDDDSHTLASLNNYGHLLWSLGRAEEAEFFLKQCWSSGATCWVSFIQIRSSHSTITLSRGDSLGRRQEAESLYKQELDQIRSVLGDEHPRTITLLNNYAGVLNRIGRTREAESLYKQVLELDRKVLGENHPDAITSLTNYVNMLLKLGRSQEAEPLIKQVLEQSRNVLGEDHPITITSLNSYARVLQGLGRSREAEPLYKQALETRRKVLGERHPDTLSSGNNYGQVLNELGRAQEAEPLLIQALEQRREVLGEDHPDTITTLNNYAVALLALNRQDEAERLLKQALELRRKILGEDHQETIQSLTNYAFVLHSLDRGQDAAPLLKLALENCRRVLGEDHPDTIMSLSNYATVLQSLGRVQEAELLLRQALEQNSKLLGIDHPDTNTTRNNYARVLQSLGRPQEAEPLLKQALENRRKVLGEDHPNTLISVQNYANVLRELGRLPEAEALYKQALAPTRRVLGEDHPYTTSLLNNYAAALESLGRAQDAEPLLKQALDTFGRVHGENHPNAIKALNNYVRVLNSLGRWQEAESLLQQALDKLRKVLGDVHPDTLTTMNALAWLLATSPIDTVRDGNRAIELATQACELTNYENPTLVETLAAAFAETGDFDSAVKWSRKSLELLGEKGDSKVRERFSQALAKYNDKKPMRQDLPPANDNKLQNEQSDKTQPSTPSPREPIAHDNDSSGQ